MKAYKLGTVVFLGASLVATGASAQELEGDRDYMDVISDYGLALTVGGGVSGFTDETMRDSTDVGATWAARAAFGTRSPVGIEAGYLGSAQAVDALGLDTDAVLLGTAIEGLARVNLLPRGEVNPYFFGGAAWRRYDVVNADTNTSDISDSDNLLEIPLGVGVSYRISSFVADVRGELRVATGEDLIRTDVGEDAPGLHSWGASARIGYEF